MQFNYTRKALSMKNRPPIQSMVFLFSSFVLVFCLSVMCVFAQVRPDISYTSKDLADFDRLTPEEKISRFESLSLEQKSIFFRTLSDVEKLRIFDLLSQEDKQKLFEGLSYRDKEWLFENLSDEDKKNLYQLLSDEDKELIFESLSDKDKIIVFEALNAKDKESIFKNLSDADKRRIFKGLSEPEKSELFRSLDDADKRRVFRGLSDKDKRMLFSSLSEPQKKEWLMKYPELELVIGPEEIPPAVPEKPVKTVEEAEAPSDIERIMSGQFPTHISRELRQFGYDFFKRDISAFTPIAKVPVGPDYIIGPGDNFTIHLWGKAEKTYNITVTREGNITVPRLGTMTVIGMTFAELKPYLYHKFKQYYPYFEMSITMGSLRTVEVFIVGEAKSPGTYSVISLSTAITALFEAGGPTKKGSLRNIKIFRNREQIRSLDLYEFFIRGNKGDDLRLQPGDTIFVPVLGPVVGIAGCVKRPAIYELKEAQTTIDDVIELAGGVLPIGYLQNVVIERVEGNKRRVIRSFNLDPSYEMTNSNLLMSLKDGDVVKVYPVHKETREVVYLEGHVKYPREYELRPGMKLRDIIPSYDYLLPEPYLPQAEIVRLIPPDLHPEILEFNLNALMNGDPDQNLLLQDQDRVIIYDKWEKREKPEVTIKGAIRNPGTYRLYKGMTVKDLIFQAGNLDNSAYQEKADLSRAIPGETGTDIMKVTFSPRKAMAGNPEENLLLQQDDQICIREIPQYSQALERKVFLEGEFLFPGEYAFSEGERLISVIERAGGLTEEAYPFGAVFLRSSVKEVQRERLKEYVSKLEQDVYAMSALSAETATDKEQAAALAQSLASKRELLEKLRKAEPTGRMVIDLREVLVLSSSPYNFELRPEDRLIVKKRPDSVNILGEVYNPTALFAEKGKNVGYYLNLVGGPTENAEDDEIYIVKANGSVISKSQGGVFGLVSWDSAKHRWTLGGFDSIKLDPGDTVIVPRKVEKFPWLRVVKDITQIMFQIAVTAGVIIAAY
jgi:protein involved in polysaccharide export with SLBB domain